MSVKLASRVLVALAYIALASTGCRSPNDPLPDFSSLELPSIDPLASSSQESVGGRTDSGHAPSQTGALNTPAVSHLPDVGPSDITQVAYQQEVNVEPPAPLGSVPTSAAPELSSSDLSLVGLERLALQNNPAVARAVARVEAAQGNWVQVGLPPNPDLGYSGQQLGSGGQAEQQGGYLGQQFITGKKLYLNREIAAWQVKRAQQELEAFRLRVLTDVRIGYYDVLIAQRRRDLTTDLVRISIQGVEAAQALFNGEEVSRADPLRARIEADTARILLQNSINQHVEAWRRLTAVLGTPELAIQRLTGELNADSLTLSWQETLQQVLNESPEITAAAANVQAARWGVRRARAQVIPNIDVQAIIQDDRSTGATNGNLQVTLPIPFWNRNQGGIRLARAEVIAAERAVDRLELNLQARLATAFQRYESARNQVDQYSRKDGILDNANRTLELIRTGYKADEFGVLELLSAQRTYFQTNLAYLDSLRSQWVSVMEIRGLLLRDSLSF